MKKYILATIASLMLMLPSCTPNTYTMGEVDVTADDLVEGIAYSITHDATNPNIVYLTSLMSPNYQCLWNHPQGRSQGSTIVLQMPFEGEYEVTFGVQTRGGYVYGAPAKFTIDQFCADFVNDELWTCLTGGVGKSKRWKLDIDGHANVRHFVGPLYFYGTVDCWEGVTEGQTLTGDTWNWMADWAGNGSWLFGDTGAMDYGVMEFSLIGGANIVVDNYATGITSSGTFKMDTKNHTMTTTDAVILHDPGRESIVTKWNEITILALTEDYMQLAVLRDNSDEGNCLLSYNFVSEDFYNSWAAPTDNNPLPELNDNWEEEISVIKNTTIKWALDATEPFDWCDVYGVRKNANTGISVAADCANLVLEMNSSNNKYTFTLPDGTETAGVYSTTSDGLYTFDAGLGSWLIGDDYIYFKTTADNSLRVLSYTLNDNGAASDLWLGIPLYDNNGKLYQYLGYHFVAQVDTEVPVGYKTDLEYFNTGWTFQVAEYVYIENEGTYTITLEGADSTPYGIYLDIYGILTDHPNLDIILKDIKVDGTSVAFDDSAIDRGIGDADDIARRYILNPWGNPPAFADANVFIFNSTIDVTFEVIFDTGTPFIK